MFKSITAWLEYNKEEVIIICSLILWNLRNNGLKTPIYRIHFCFRSLAQTNNTVVCMQINPFLRIQNNKKETITKRTTVSLIKPLTCARGENTAHHLIEYLGKMCKSVLEIWYAKDRAESEKNRHLCKTEDETIQFFSRDFFCFGFVLFRSNEGILRISSCLITI